MPSVIDAVLPRILASLNQLLWRRDFKSRGLQAPTHIHTHEWTSHCSLQGSANRRLLFRETPMHLLTVFRLLPGAKQQMNSHVGCLIIACIPAQSSTLYLAHSTPFRSSTLNKKHSFRNAVLTSALFVTFIFYFSTSKKKRNPLRVARLPLFLSVCVRTLISPLAVCVRVCKCMCGFRGVKKTYYFSYFLVIKETPARWFRKTPSSQYPPCFFFHNLFLYFSLYTAGASRYHRFVKISVFFFSYHYRI